MEVEFSNIDFSYGKVVALKDVSLRVGGRKFTCIVGPNGAGKSTVAQIIAGILRADRGTIIRDGEISPHASPEQIARKGLSLVPEGRHIFTTLTVEENLRIAGGVASAHGMSPADQDLETEKTLERFPILKERLNNYAGSLSGGEQQQLAISRALLTFPSLLIIDEPSLGLAPKITEQVYRHLVSINQEKEITLLVIEQSFHRALDVADQVIVMRNGRVKLNKARSDIVDQAELEAAFFGFGGSKDHLPEATA